MNKEPLAIDNLIANSIEDMQQKAKGYTFAVKSPSRCRWCRQTPGA